MRSQLGRLLSRRDFSTAVVDRFGKPPRPPRRGEGPNYSEIFAHKYAELAKTFEFRPASLKDLPTYMDLMKSYYEEEPFVTVIGATLENARNSNEARHIYALQTGTPFGINMLLIHKPSGKAVGFRDGSVQYRNEADSPYKYNPDNRPFSAHDKCIIATLGHLKNQMWSIYPMIDKYIKGEILYIKKEFRAPGLASVFFEYGINYENATKEIGARYLVNTNTALQSKALCDRMGYMCVAVGPPFTVDTKGKMVELPHGPIHLVTKDMLKGIDPINVEPYWKRMGIVE